MIDSPVNAPSDSAGSRNIVSRQRWMRRGLAAGLVAALVVANLGPAPAQDQPAAPTVILPDGDRPPPIDIAPAPDPTATAPTTSDPAAAPVIRDSTISINTLDAIDADSIGLLDDIAGGYGSEMWRGSDIARVERLMAALPYDARSPAMRNIMRRLLLSTAARPDREAAGGSRAPGDFLALRLAGLARLGYDEPFAELVGRVPGGALRPPARVAEAEVKFLGGDADGACGIVRAQLRQDEALFWQQAMVYCQILAGEQAAAGLSLDLLREFHPDLDPAYLAVVDNLLGLASELPEAAIADPLTLAMALSAETALPKAVVEAAAPPVLAAIARADRLPPDVRIAAAERAVDAGALAAVDLGRLYGEIQFSLEELENAVAAAGELGGAWGRALLYQASRQQQPATERAAVLAEALRAARADVGPTVGARVNEVAVQTLVPSPQLIWFAPEAVAVLIGSDRPELARNWLDMLAQEAPYNDQAARNLARLRPVVAIADIDFARTWDPAMARAWWDALPDAEADGEILEIALGDDSQDFAAEPALPPTPAPAGESRLTRATRMFMALDALGLTIGADAWDALLAEDIEVQVTVPNVGVRYALRDAARAKRVGETIMLGLLGIGEAGPAASALAMGGAIRGLRAHGFEYDARQLALEAILEGGV